MGIVQEIQEACRPIIETVTGFTRLNYEYDLENNSDRGHEKRYGFTPGSADFADGRSIGFTTMNHTFNLKLVDDFNNKDCDDNCNATIMGLYEKAQDLLKELQKSKLALPTPTNLVLLISGLTFEEPDINNDNFTVALNATFNIQYRYRNN